MDWRLLLSTFFAVFLAELGDKTQLATLALAGGRPSRWAVFLGASLALVVSSAIAVLAGGAVARVVPAVWITRAAGLLFLGMGAWLLWSAR